MRRIPSLAGRGELLDVRCSAGRNGLDRVAGELDPDAAALDSGTGGLQVGHFVDDRGLFAAAVKDRHVWILQSCHLLREGLPKTRRQFGLGRGSTVMQFNKFVKV